MMRGMRAVLVDPAEHRLVVDDVPDPTPGAGQLLVRVAAAGVNRADLFVTAGTYHGREPASRFVAGSELAGEVVGVGAAVEGWQVGDRVMAMGPGFAELAAVHASVAMPVPPALDDERAGSLPVALATMHDALVTHGHCGPGGHAVVNAASSGVGVVGVRIALQLGAATRHRHVALRGQAPAADRPRRRRPLPRRSLPTSSSSGRRT